MSKVGIYQVVRRALVLLDRFGGDLEKAQPFGTYGGSSRYAKRIVPLIPPHVSYVEPFAGAAAVLYAKAPSEREVIADIDEDIVFMHRFIKAMTPQRLEALRRRFDWTVTRASFRRAITMKPRDDLERFYKLVFVRSHVINGRPDKKTPSPSALGATTNPERYLKAAERLRRVTILRQDYRKTIARFDSDATFFFVDPPYPGKWFAPRRAIDLEEFVATLSTIRGKYIAVLDSSPRNLAALRPLGQLFRLRVREASGFGGLTNRLRLFCANYPVRKMAGALVDLLP